MSKKKTQAEKFIVFSVSGGIGKNIAATAVVRGLHSNYPDRKIVVLTAHTDPWLFNPYIHRVYAFDKALYFYDNYIKDKDVLVFAQDPYHHQDYILRKRHLVGIWSDMCGSSGLIDISPDLHFNKREVEFALNNFAAGDYVVIQTHGGATPEIKHSWYRDIPIQFAQSIVDKLTRNGIRVIHVRRNDQPALRGTEQFQGTTRQCWLLLRYAKASLLMDSMMQHAAAAMGVRSTVLWIGNKPDNLGYPIHDNIVADVDLDTYVNPYAVLNDYGIIGLNEECPIPEDYPDLFDITLVMASLTKSLNI